MSRGSIGDIVGKDQLVRSWAVVCSGRVRDVAIGI